ncbi:MAG: hypothetical protein ACI8WB_004060 [Phenylobacterium sp.]|jgi:hypothetical protein
MVCHGELARLKPVQQQLTLFYLLMATGGVVGSLFTSILAEKMFTQYYEFPIGIMLVYALLAITIYQQRVDGQQTKPVMIQNMWLGIASVGGLIAFGLYFVKLDKLYYQDDVHNSRNFYGTLAVKDIEANQRVLFDGTTSHGTQSLSPQQSQTPTSYYRHGTGVSLALESNEFRPVKRAAKKSRRYWFRHRHFGQLWSCR